MPGFTPLSQLRAAYKSDRVPRGDSNPPWWSERVSVHLHAPQNHGAGMVTAATRATAKKGNNTTTLPIL